MSVKAKKESKWAKISNLLKKNTPCKTCQKTVNKKDKICPHCGEKYPGIDIAARKKGCLFFLAGFSLFILFIIMIAPSEKNIKQTEPEGRPNTLKGGYIGCLSEDLFDQMSQAKVREDARGIQYLLENGCIITRSGIDISVIDTSWSGVTKVRAYVGDETFILWTNTENVQQ